MTCGEVVEVLLMALTIISTVGTVVGALAALAALRRSQQREAKPSGVAIAVNDVTSGMVDPERDTLAEIIARYRDELRELLEGDAVSRA